MTRKKPLAGFCFAKLANIHYENMQKNRKEKDSISEENGQTGMIIS